MSTVITSGDHTVEPALVLGFESEREGGSIVHPILGRAEPDITIRPAATRSGKLELLFTGESAETDSAAAEEVFAAGALCVLSDSDRATVAMTFAPGTVTRALDEDTRRAWTVTVAFTEVAV